MDITPITLLEERGTVLSLPPGATFNVQDPGKIWWVLEGRLDIFLVETADGKPPGARRHILRVEAGNPLIGFDTPSDAGVGLIACPAVNSRLLELQRNDLELSPGCSPENVIPLIDQWVEILGTAGAARTTPKSFRVLSPGEETVMDDQATAVMPQTGVVWVRLLEGSSCLRGDHEMPPPAPGDFYPVCRSSWLECAPHSRVACHSTRQWLQADPQWSGLRRYQGQIFSSALAEKRRAEDKEKARLVAVRESDSRVLEGAFQRLAAPLRGGSASGLEADAGALDPLLQACLQVAQASGIPVSAGLYPQGISKRQEPIKFFAQACRIRTRQVVLKGRWWEEESVPMVGFYQQRNRPVALLPSRQGYEVVNPATRERKAVTAALAEELRGGATVFYRPFPHKALTALDLASFGARGCRGDLLTILLVGMATGMLGVATPVLTGIIFDTIIPGARRRTLAEFTLFLVCSAVATALFAVTRSLATLRLQSRMEASIQAAVWDRLLALPVPFFRQFTAGDLARRSLGISQIRQALTGPVLTSLFSGVFSFASCALMFYYSWRMALVASLLVLISFLVSVLSGWLQVRILRGVTALGGRISGMTLQFINGIAKFRVGGTEARAFGVWARTFGQQRLLSMKARKISNLVITFNSVFPVLALAVIFDTSSSLLNTPAAVLTTGQFLAFLAAFVQFSSGTLELSTAFTSVLRVIPLYERAKPILATLPEVSSAQSDPGELSGSMEIHNLSFRYRQEGPLVLRNLSIDLPAGRFIAFVGPSGSGKSTLFRLLMGFETPASGAIYYDGQDLAELDVQVVRRQIGVVLQNARLATGSIFRNIVGEGTLTLEDAWEAARHAGFEEDLKAMPMGMHTTVSEGGGGLSGGQRQRLLIARAIVRKPRILLFDEATSALDNRTQAIVSQSLAALNATRVVIAHRLSTVIHAERICVLDKGVMVQSGNYEELMATEGLFRQLAMRQLS